MIFNNSPLVRVYEEGEGYLNPKDFVMSPSDSPLIVMSDGSGDVWFETIPPDKSYWVERYVHLNENTGEGRKLFEGDIISIKGTDPFDTLTVFFGEVILEDGCAKALEVGGEERIQIFDNNFFRDFEIVGNVHGQKYH